MLFSCLRGGGGRDRVVGETADEGDGQLNALRV
jgi:hypothetical protein